MAGWSVGLDVGGTKTHGVLLDAAGAVRGTVRLPTAPGGAGVVDTVEAAVRDLCRAAVTDPAGLRGVGLGVPGVVDAVTGDVAHAVNLRIDDAGSPLGRLVADRLGVPVTVENDLNAAALGAARVLGLPGDLAVLSLGTGVAAGLLLDGRLRRGARGAAGEIGHLTHRPDGPVCPCGQRGCLELYASGATLDVAWPVPEGRHAPAEVFAAAAAADPRAVRVRDDFVDAVAHAVRVLVLTCDVEHVLVGGGVAEVGAPLLDAVRAAVRRQVAGSAFLRSLGVDERLRLLPSGTLAAPIGAALSVEGAGGPVTPSTAGAASTPAPTATEETRPEEAQWRS